MPSAQVPPSHATFKLAAIGTLAGIFSGLFGVGGGTVIVPLLIFWFGYGERLATGTSLAAIENPYVDCIGHLTGRLIGRREPYGIDVEAVAEAAAGNGTMIEINGNPNRRDLSEHHARLASEAGVTIVLNTDAHGVDTLNNMSYAVATARRAWLTKGDIANTRSWSEFKKLIER
jgi:DNA polymerase (family 10)